MARKKQCRDCKECHRPALSRLLRGTVRVTAAVSTGFVTEAANAASRAASEICPICNHRMGLHEDRRGGVAR